VASEQLVDQSVADGHGSSMWMFGSFLPLDRLHKLQDTLVFDPNGGLGIGFWRHTAGDFNSSVTATSHFLPRSSPVEAKFSERLLSLSEGDISAIIQMAWEDRTAFETIQERMGWSQADVIRLMRHELQPNSFRMWRKRMKGRTTKHRTLRSPDMKFKDRLVANHRRANC
jgi:uncharacterized protein (TIGR03643 family)